MESEFYGLLKWTILVARKGDSKSNRIEVGGMSAIASDNDHGSGTHSSILLRSFPEGETLN